jgi:hypothetical protein
MVWFCAAILVYFSNALDIYALQRPNEMEQIFSAGMFGWV